MVKTQILLHQDLAQFVNKDKDIDIVVIKNLFMMKEND